VDRRSGGEGEMNCASKGESWRQELMSSSESKELEYKQKRPTSQKRPNLQGSNTEVEGT